MKPEITLREICPLLWSLNAYIELRLAYTGYTVETFTNVELTENYGGAFADYIVADIESSTHCSVNVYLKGPNKDKRKCLEKELEEDGW